MNHVPDDLYYARTHEWARKEADGRVRVGISDFAQEQLGDVVFIQLPEMGRSVQAGEACALIESVKSASDIHSPLSGAIVAVNPSLEATPESVNNDAYAAWLFLVAPNHPDELNGLLDGAGYRAVTASGG